MRDYSKEPVVQAVIISKDAQAFEELKQDFSNFGLARTVLNWNILKIAAKKIYAREVIGMLDASGFINIWLKG
jgi:hypothetical protein